MIRLNQNRCRYCIVFPCECEINGYRDVNQEGGFLPVVAGIVGAKFLSDKLLRRRPKPIRKFMENEGQKKIVSIKVCRSPVSKVLKSIINVVSLGMLKRKMKEKSYDELFHLFAVLEFEDGSIKTIEKNERVMVTNGDKSTSNTVCAGKHIMKNPITANKFISDAEKKGDKNFWIYSADKYNCQRFIKDLMNAQGITQFDSFIKQDTEDLMPGYVKKFSNAITGIGGIVDFALRGGEYEMV